MVDDTTGSEEVLIISWGPHGASCSILAPETMVSGPHGTSGGRSDFSTTVSQSPQPTTLPLSSSRDRQAVPSCLETIQRFARPQGFSSRVAKQLGFARRTSSRAVYQARCRFIGVGVGLRIIPSLDLHFPRSQSSFYGYIVSGSFQYRRSWVTATCCQLYSALSCRSSPFLLFYKSCYILLR